MQLQNTHQTNFTNKIENVLSVYFYPWKFTVGNFYIDIISVDMLKSISLFYCMHTNG